MKSTKNYETVRSQQCPLRSVYGLKQTNMDLACKHVGGGGRGLSGPHCAWATEMPCTSHSILPCHGMVQYGSVNRAV